MSHKQHGLSDLVAVTASVALWLILLIIVGEALHTEDPLFPIFTVPFITTMKILMLLLALLPVFAFCWITGGRIGAIGRAVCQRVGRFYRWAFDLPELLKWHRLKLLGRCLSMSIALPLILPLFFLTIFALIYTWPINMALGVALITILVANFVSDSAIEKISQYEVIGKATRSAFLPIAYGMCGVFWFQLFLSIFDIDSRRVRLYENHLAHISAEAKYWVDFSIPASIALACSLVLLIFIFPTIKLAPRFLSMKTGAAKFTAFLACISGFTFLSQAPFKYQDWHEFRRIQAEKRTGDEGTRAAALSATSLIAENLSATQERYYRDLFEELNDTVPYRDQGRVIEALVGTRIAIPSNGSNQPQARAESQRKQQTLDVVQDLFCTIIGAKMPDIKGVAGKFIEALVDQESDLLFANKIRPKVEAEIDKIALEAGQQELEKFTAMQTEDQDAQSERLEIEQIHADLTKLEDQIRKEDVIHEMEYRAEHPAEEPE